MRAVLVIVCAVSGAVAVIWIVRSTPSAGNWPRAQLTVLPETEQPTDAGLATTWTFVNWLGIVSLIE